MSSSLASGSSIVPYATGGVGGLSLFSREAFGIDQTDTLFASNIGGGVKWYAGRWGFRGDYRFLLFHPRTKRRRFSAKRHVTGIASTAR
jgi:hypothetical protein